MLHVTVAKSEDGLIVRLSGDLSGEFVAEADLACAAADAPLVVDAGQLRRADADGLAWLATTRDRGVLITGLSGYLEMRLERLKGTEP